MYKLTPGVKNLVFLFMAFSAIYFASVLCSGCAQIVSPTGGNKDTLAPQLVSSNPANGTTNFRGNKITLNFNEYIVVEQLQENLLVSPTPQVNPYVDYKLRTVTIKLRDSLQSNTTYTINLGNAIKDLNEGNIYKDFSFIFSTGPVIDSLRLNGKIILAETGGTDSTMFALLYKNLDDSAVLKQKPSFISRVNSAGEFSFSNLPSGTFRLFGLKDRDNGRTYNNLTEVFAFMDTTIFVNESTAPQILYAYAERKESTTSTSGRIREKNLKFTSKVISERQDITDPLIVNFNSKITTFNPASIILADTSNVAVGTATIALDTSRRQLVITNQWKENTAYRLIINKDAARDSAGLTLAKSDTIKFMTKSSEDYGMLTLRFNKLPGTGNMRLQFVSGNDIVYTSPLASTTWSNKLFKPGEYKLRILLDQNNNGIWDPGSYSKKLQPERVVAIPQAINVKANWENEIDIKL